jgi:NADH-quinone oxidoreductase subunit A
MLADAEGAGPPAWAPVALMILIAVGFALGTVILSVLVGPSRQGPGKSQTYESGMVPIGDTRRRFNVRFYIVAMIFLVFDVDIIFFYPFAVIFPGRVLSDPAHSGMLLASMAVFVAILLVAYFYAWGKGVFRWD